MTSTKEGGVKNTPLITLPTPLKLDVIEFYRFQLRLQLRDSMLNPSEETVLVYFYLYENPIEQLVLEKKFKNPKSVENIVSKLRGMPIPLLVGKGNKTRLNEIFNFCPTSFTVTMEVELLTKQGSGES